jgi:branched-chain amino acid transport system permease protein
MQLGALVVAVLLAVLATRLLQKSAFGRLLRAIRDNEPAVAALGKDPAGYKIRVFMLGAALAGIAGAFYAHFVTFITPEQFVPLVTFYVWMSIILGGVGSMRGALLGTLVLVVFLEGSRFLRDWVPGIAEAQMAHIRLGVVGLALILCMLYRPQGIFGKRVG